MTPDIDSTDLTDYFQHHFYLCTKNSFFFITQFVFHIQCIALGAMEQAEYGVLLDIYNTVPLKKLNIWLVETLLNNFHTLQLKHVVKYFSLCHMYFIYSVLYCIAMKGVGRVRSLQHSVLNQLPSTRDHLYFSESIG